MAVPFQEETSQITFVETNVFFMWDLSETCGTVWTMEKAHMASCNLECSFCPKFQLNLEPRYCTDRAKKKISQILHLAFHAHAHTVCACGDSCLRAHTHTSSSSFKSKVYSSDGKFTWCLFETYTLSEHTRIKLFWIVLGLLSNILIDCS